MTELALAEAVPLAHAVVARTAEIHDVRVLFIKGPVAASQGLRSGRSSVDVDALVDPARRRILAQALTEQGWVDENPYTSPTVLPHHSLTHRHASWPCEVDLHDRFPGFFVEPQQAFDILWQRRRTACVAGYDIPCPDSAGQALILALNSLRDPHDPVRLTELEELLARMAAREEEFDLHELAELADALGAADTAAPFLERLGAPLVGAGTTGAGDLRSWRLLTQPADSTAVSWVESLRRRPMRSWPRYLWYAAWLTETELRLADPGLAVGRLPVLRARLRRLRRGMRAAPAALRSVRQVDRAG